jgi:hypothetical protein
MAERQSKSTVSMKALQTGGAASADRVPRDIVVVYRQVSALKLDPHNPRVHSPRQIRQIARSIGAFGFNVPVLVDSALKLIAGQFLSSGPKISPVFCSVKGDRDSSNLIKRDRLIWYGRQFLSGVGPQQFCDFGFCFPDRRVVGITPRSALHPGRHYTPVGITPRPVFTPGRVTFRENDGEEPCTAASLTTDIKIDISATAVYPQLRADAVWSENPPTG